MKDNTGICLIQESGFSSLKYDFAEIENFVKSMPEVKAVWNFEKVKKLSKEEITASIVQSEINHLILAGDYPGFYHSFFKQILVDNPKVKLTQVAFAEKANLNGKSTEMAKIAIMSAVKGVKLSEMLDNGKKLQVHPDTLIIGGGIAGIQAALEIANGGQKVHLLEKSGTIGGHMAMFDKTFPTLDCAACILTPKMVDVGQHPNINLITYAEIVNVTGEPGNYTVGIHQKARRVNLATCIGCGTCAEKCPRKAPSEFDAGTSLRPAIYIPFPQAVPNKYLIDADHCTYVENGKCGVCVKVCPVPGCINLDEQDSYYDITVGNIIVATGFSVFDAKKATQFGYGKFPNVLTSLEFERLINAAGPTGGNITYRKQDKKGNWIFEQGNGEPASVAIIHCIGSRDVNFNKYCSKVCCMYSLKLAHLVKEKIHDAEVFEYFIDMRAFGKGYEEFYERIKNEGVHIIRGKTAKIDEKDGKLMIRSEDILNARLIEHQVDMVILAVGLEAGSDSAKIADILGINQSSEGWFKELDYLNDPASAFQPGISIAGVCQGPKDIPDTVAQASAAASRVLRSIMAGTLDRNTTEADINIREMEARINK